MRIHNLILTATLVLTGLTPAAAAPVLEKIILPGLWKTDPEFIKTVMDSREGAPFSATTFEADLDRIRSWELYRYVRGTTYPSAGGVTAVVELGERWSITPVFRPITGGGVYSLKVGLRDTNFLGRFYEIALYGGGRANWDGKEPLADVEIQPIFGGWTYLPYLHGGPWEGIVTVDVDFLEDRVYDWGTLRSVTSRRLIQSYVGIGYRFSDTQHLRTWVGYTISRDELRPDFAEIGSPAPLYKDLHTFTIGPEFVYGQPVYREPYYSGGDTLAQILARISDDIAPAVELRVQQRWFVRFWKRFNLAVRGLTEWTTSRDWIRLQTLGGLTNLRGYPDRYFHARGYVVGSVELRGTVLHWDWSSLQLKVFADTALIAGVDHGDRVEPYDATITVGAGFFYWLPLMHKLRLRLDIARPLDRGMIGGVPDISSGIVQFF